MEELLAYDVTGNSPLFGDDGFMQKSTKSELVHELEKHLSPEDYAGPLSSGHMPGRRYGPYEKGQLKIYINFWRADWKDIWHYKCDFSSG